MFRPGRNPKGDQAHTDDTADHTPHTPASTYGSSSNTGTSTGASSGGVGSGGGMSSGGGIGSSSSSGAGATSGTSDLYPSSGATPNTSRAVTESESLARDIKEGTLSGFVGNGTTLTGEANFKGMLRVDGHLSGRVSSTDGTLIVSTNGQVDANVEVAVAQIFGTVNGDIIATKRIEMGRVAKVTGNIQTPALVIENGALFEGSCRMVQLKEAQDKGRPSDGAKASTSPASGSSAVRETQSSAGSDIASASEVAS
ncbi:MAG TPA: polymer-forming cytoskeletal protein [Pyrinomonadaceae bacterium]|nr:polymer-forming cytoskeletal protein [Pyrinomonadaceae bacterium]